MGYDVRGRANKTVDPDGTIRRTFYDGLDRVSSEWVGSDDTPTSGYWAPTNTAGTDLVKFREYTYDGGGVGHGGEELLDGVAGQRAGGEGGLAGLVGVGGGGVDGEQGGGQCAAAFHVLNR